MTKKELEEELKNIQDDYDSLNKRLNVVSKRIEENIQLINATLKIEKNKDKTKLLEGLKNEFLYIQNILGLNELTF